MRGLHHTGPQSVSLPPGLVPGPHELIVLRKLGEVLRFVSRDANLAVVPFLGAAARRLQPVEEVVPVRLTVPGRLPGVLRDHGVLEASVEHLTDANLQRFGVLQVAHLVVVKHRLLAHLVDPSQKRLQPGRQRRADEPPGCVAPVVHHHLRRGRVGYLTRAVLLVGPRQVPAAHRVVTDAVHLVLLPAGDEHRVDGTKRPFVVDDVQAAGLAHEHVLPVPILLAEQQVKHRRPDHVLVGDLLRQRHGPRVDDAAVQSLDGCALRNLVELHAGVNLNPGSLVTLLPGDERLDVLGPRPGRGGGQVGILCQLV